MTPLLAERADSIAEVIKALHGSLNEAERKRFAFELQEAARHGDQEEIHHTLRSWMLTVAIRSHPDYEDQYKEFVRLRESGDAFAGTPVAEVSFPKAI